MPDEDAAETQLGALATATVAVVSPGLLTSVTIEPGADGEDEIHLHPAGQGYWVARMVRALGARPVLVTACGGEAADVAAPLVGSEVDLRLVRTAGNGGVYVDDRRGGDRTRIADAPPATLDRHAVDDLVSSAVTEGLAAGLVVLTGSNQYGSVAPAFYSTVSAALAALGVTVVVDLSGAELAAALEGHVDVIKVADDELRALRGRAPDGRADADGDVSVDTAWLRACSGADVFVTRAGDGALAELSCGRYVGRGPVLRTVDHRGAGDSFTAALAAGRSAGLDPIDQFRVALAAAAANVLRHGLGSATAPAVASMLDRVDVVAAPT